MKYALRSLVLLPFLAAMIVIVKASWRGYWKWRGQNLHAMPAAWLRSWVWLHAIMVLDIYCIICLPSVRQFILTGAVVLPRNTSTFIYLLPLIFLAAVSALGVLTIWLARRFAAGTPN